MYDSNRERPRCELKIGHTRIRHARKCYGFNNGRENAMQKSEGKLESRRMPLRDKKYE